MKTTHPSFRNPLRRWQIALLTPVLLAAAALPASAQVLLEENFSFTGALTSNGWTAFSGAGTAVINASAPGLTYPNLPSSGAGNAAALTANGEDVRKPFSSPSTSGDIYASVLVNMTSASSGGDYFYSFYSVANGYFGRLFAKTSGSGFVLGISKNATGSYDTTELAFGTTYLVVIKIKRNEGTGDDVASLWVNPPLGSSETTPAVTNNSGNDPATLDNIALRQTSSTPVVRLGSILIGTTWASVTPSEGLPVISPSGTLEAFSTFAGTASASQSFTVTGTGLTSNITATAPVGIQVSTDNASFGPTAALPLTGGTFYVRVAASAPVGELASSVTLSSAGATDVPMAVNGAVRPTSIALPYGPDTFTTSSFPWYSYTVTGSANWTRATLTGNSFMQVNGFSSPVAANAWLILGPFDLPAAQNIVATFNMQKAYAGPDSELNLKYSTNYSGTGDPTSSSWTSIPFTKPASVGNTATSTVFTPSGAVALPSALAGQSGVYIAFHYDAAGIGIATSTWRMDDFELFASSLPVISVLVNPSTIDEGSAGTGTVVLPSVAVADTDVTVTSADPSLVLVSGGGSTVVTVPAGFSDAQFDVTTTRDFTPGPDQQVQIVADGGAAYEFGQTIVTVRNTDLPSVSLTAGGYTQNFSTFTSQATLPTGWALGASIQTYSAWGDTNTTSGAKFSSATANVFGYQHTGDTGTVQQTLTLRNDTGSTLTDLVVSYRGRMARATQTRNPAYAVSMGGFTVPALAYSTSEGDNVLCVANVSGLNVEPNQTVQILWSSDRGVLSGTSRQIGVSDVSVTLGSTPLPPAVRNLIIPVASIGQTSATAEANVVADQGSAVTSRGFVYALTSVNPDPTVGGAGVTNLPQASAEVGPMTESLSGLSTGTQYSVKAYATNANGTSYTAARTFVTISAPISFSGTYAEAFNDFTTVTSPDLAAGSVKTGWTAISSGGIQSYGGSWTTSSSTGGFYGGVSNPGALGYQPTTSTGTLTVTSRMVNNTGAPLTQLYVKYLGRTQMTANTRIPTWAVTVAGVASSELGYSTSAGIDETKSALVTGLNVPVGSGFEITWVSDQGSGSGSFRRIGLADVIVSVSPIPDPAISVTGSLTSFAATLGSASASQSFSASGVGISGDITVTAPANYEVSLNNSTFSSFVTLTPTGGTVASTLVYVRIAASAPAGNPAGQVSLASFGATTQNIAVTGTVSGGGSAYDTWASGFSLDPATTGAPTADPDGDSFSNAQEYAFGTNPTQGNGSLLSSTASGANLVVTWLERSDVNYNVQSTGNLATSFANDGTVSVVDGPVSPTPPAGYTSKQFTVPVSGSKFYRVTAATP